jgi:hypothetical protein
VLVFRLVLLITNLGLFAALTREAVKNPAGWNWLGYALFACLAANVIYLLLNPERMQLRVFRVLSLWLDAKETELRKRVRENSN